MILGFTGTQLGMTDSQLRTLANLFVDTIPDVLLHGDCIGADAEADVVAAELGICRHIMPCNIFSKRAWTNRVGSVEISCPLPPLERNSKIVEACEHLIAAPKTSQEELRSGTWSTIRRARKLRKKITIIWPDGSITVEEDDSLSAPI